MTVHWVFWKTSWIESVRIVVYPVFNAIQPPAIDVHTNTTTLFTTYLRVHAKRAVLMATFHITTSQILSVGLATSLVLLAAVLFYVLAVILSQDIRNFQILQNVGFNVLKISLCLQYCKNRLNVSLAVMVCVLDALLTTNASNVSTIRSFSAKACVLSTAQSILLNISMLLPIVHSVCLTQWLKLLLRALLLHFQ